MAPIFHPRPTLQSLPLPGGSECLIVDDALCAPQEWVDFAVAQRARFAAAPFNAYPGLEQPTTQAFALALDDFFRIHVRRRLGARRTLAMHSRMSLVTLAPEALEPRQWMCHRDSQSLEPGEMICASVLYLFHDERLGGTSFWRPRRDAARTAQLIHDAGALDRAAFLRAYPGTRAGYPFETNDWFERTAIAPPRFNRMVFYDGGLFHAGHLPHPALLSDDPARGRLTINGFFTCSRMAR